MNKNNDDSFLNGLLQGCEIKERLTALEWAIKKHYLSSAVSKEHGKYDIERTPYMKEPLEMMTIGNGIHKVVMMIASQMGKTEACLAWLGYLIDMFGGNILIMERTLEDCKKFSKIRLDNLIEDNPILKKKFLNQDETDIENNILNKKFLSGSLMLLSSEKPVRSIPAAFSYGTELDAWKKDARNEGNPVKLLEQRSNTFADIAKQVLESTPGIEHLSLIEDEERKGDQRRYFIPCPHCKHEQVLVLPNLKFKEKYIDCNFVDPNSIYYECEKCKGKILESDKTSFLKNGRWKPTNLYAQDGIRSYQLNALYSPIGMKKWETICNDFLQSKHDPELLKTFVNTTLAETWKEKIQQPKHHELFKRREKYSVVPMPACILTGGVDIQDDRIAMFYEAWGEGMERWFMDYIEIPGDLKDPKLWDQVNEYFRKPIKHESGLELYIRRVGIDIGGHFTNYVYEFCEQNKDLFIPVKGASVDKGFIMPLKPNERGLWLVGTHSAKSYIYEQLTIKESGRRYVHFNDFEENFFIQLTSERMVIKRENGVNKIEWLPTPGLRNEVLDVVVYSLATAHSLNIKLLNTQYKEIYQRVITDKLENVKPKADQKLTKFSNSSKMGGIRNGKTLSMGRGT